MLYRLINRKIVHNKKILHSINFVSLINSRNAVSPSHYSTVKTSKIEITDESDFAFRKNEIKLLGLNDQDNLFYPPIDDAINEISDGVSKFQRLRVPEFREKYSYLVDEDIEKVREGENSFETIVLNGKITSIRKAGKGSMFIDISQDFKKIQLIVHHKIMNIDKNEFNSINSGFRNGDQIIVIGKPGITKVKELSLRLIRPIKLASPSLHPLPVNFSNSSKLHSNRVIDYLVNIESKQILLVRSRIISIIRNYFDRKGFIEFETPIILSGNSGANATPFVTSSIHLKDEGNNLKKLNLRVAPELCLKKLIISGFDKIFEIGKVFRNEGIDSTHNPEFTSCEFYQTFINLDDLMNITEELFLTILKELLNDVNFRNFKSLQDNCDKLLKIIEIENKGHFKKINFLVELEKQINFKLPQNLNYENLIKVFEKLNLELPEVKSEFQLIDKLSSIYLEPLCKDCPTFLYNLPEVLSPLSKSIKDEKGRLISKRFELYINGKEFVNAYEEENNPFKQEIKFKNQLKFKEEFNDNETILPDYKFIEFMEFAMPPTGGWGLGIDRLVMLLTGCNRIDNVLSFGKLSDVLKQ